MTQIGEVRKAGEIGYKGANGQTKYIWHACENCNTERWVQLKRGVPVYRLCYSCSMEHMVGTNHPQWKGGKAKRICGNCGKVFYAYIGGGHKAAFCSLSCLAQSQGKGKESPSWKGGLVSNICLECGKEYSVSRCAIKKGSKFCSHSCRTIYYYKKGVFRQTPNAPEKILTELLEDNKLPFRYVGNGEVWLGNRNPDFINTNGKKQVIEFMGAYWHPLFDGANRIEHYKQYGFDCLVIWEDETKDLVKVTRKLQRYSRSKVHA